MTPTTEEDPRLAEDEQLAIAHYERSIRAAIRPEDQGKFVVVAVESGDYEVDANDLAAGKRLQARRPNERLWLIRTRPGEELVMRSPRLLGS